MGPEADDHAVPPLVTDTFEVLFGPEGKVRIVLKADGRAAAWLNLPADIADELAARLASRREAYHRARAEQDQGVKR